MRNIHVEVHPMVHGDIYKHKKIIPSKCNKNEQLNRDVI